MAECRHAVGGAAGTSSSCKHVPKLLSNQAPGVNPVCQAVMRRTIAAALALHTLAQLQLLEAVELVDLLLEQSACPTASSISPASSGHISPPALHVASTTHPSASGHGWQHQSHLIEPQQQLVSRLSHSIRLSDAESESGSGCQPALRPGISHPIAYSPSASISSSAANSVCSLLSTRLCSCPQHRRCSHRGT